MFQANVWGSKPETFASVFVYSVPTVMYAWAVFSPCGPDKRLQSSASPWQQVLGYNLSMKLNGAWVTRPRAGVLPVSPIMSARSVYYVAPSPTNTHSIVLMWKKRPCSSTWLPQNNRAHLTHAHYENNTREGNFNAIMVVWWWWSSKVVIISDKDIRVGLCFHIKKTSWKNNLQSATFFKFSKCMLLLKTLENLKAVS